MISSQWLNNNIIHLLSINNLNNDKEYSVVTNNYNASILYSLYYVSLTYYIEIYNIFQIIRQFLLWKNTIKNRSNIEYNAQNQVQQSHRWPRINVKSNIFIN